ncbi:hypothetical protein BDW69DRAFT_16869 [Aspergillus filifer]
MDTGSKAQLQNNQLGKATARLGLHQSHLSFSSTSSNLSSQLPQVRSQTLTPTPTMSRDPITCHVLNTLTGTPAANLPVILTLLSTPNSSPAQDIAFIATTNADGRVANWSPLSSEENVATQTPSVSVSDILAGLPASDSKTNWALTFNVGPWFEAQGVESFWPEVEVKFTVKGRGKEGLEGWRHYHVPVLLGPWNYSTYRGS